MAEPLDRAIAVVFDPIFDHAGSWGLAVAAVENAEPSELL